MAYAQSVLAVYVAAGLCFGRDGQRLRPHFVRYRGKTGDMAGPDLPLCDFGAQDGGWAKGTAFAENPAAVAFRALIGISLPEMDRGPLMSGQWQPGGLATAWHADPPAPGDFVFSYAVSPTTPAPADIDHAAALIGALLDVVELLDEDEVIVPGWIAQGAEKRDLPAPHPAAPPEIGARTDGKAGSGHRQPLHSVVGAQPSIVALARHWSLVAGAIADGSGLPAPITGFRLRRTADWQVPSTGDPAEVYEHLGRVCNVSCKFCYLFGNPGNLAIARGTRVIRQDEVETRLRYFLADTGQALFHAEWENNETLVDPKLPQLLPRLREASDKPFFFVTNGNPLTPAMLDLLASVKPVHVIVSINSANPELRADVMRESKTRRARALEGLYGLDDRGISFGISLAAFPEFPIDDLQATIEHVATLRAAYVRINLPGYTRYLPPEHPFDTPSTWARVTEWARALRAHVRLPILVIPSAFEENLYHDDPVAARVIGTIPNSPADRAGLRPGDVIERIGLLPVTSRASAQALLSLDRGDARLTVRRGAAVHTLCLDATAGAFPYVGESYGKYRFPKGMVLAPSLSDADIRQVCDQIDDYGAKNAWVFTSRLMMPAVRRLLAPYDLWDRVRLVPVDNHYLGGNIQVLDMATIGDMTRHVEAETTAAARPDLLLSPGTGFNREGRDLLGRHWKDLPNHFDIPCELMSCSRFTF
ncbi:hypothetical protein SJ05684_b55490 (plasmid) [Sinorhizobium sojae CCBAU 05684]|uniref:Radical SAM core domain-containing protein n=2 Tax=Sinorhizobium sojae TaxID=716925 RepID=A0A249PKU2_9HYPH|nr:hypothetical protein SJ05684_b55490 [Sinorhizobium sojae CCBAU 05684]